MNRVEQICVGTNKYHTEGAVATRCEQISRYIKIANKKCGHFPGGRDLSDRNTRVSPYPQHAIYYKMKLNACPGPSAAVAQTKSHAAVLSSIPGRAD